MSGATAIWSVLIGENIKGMRTVFHVWMHTSGAVSCPHFWDVCPQVHKVSVYTDTVWRRTTKFSFGGGIFRKIDWLVVNDNFSIERHIFFEGWMPLPPIEALGIGLRGSKFPMFTVHVQAIWSTLAWWPTRWFFWVYRWHRRRWSRTSALLLSLARSCFVLAVDCAFYVSTSALRTNWLIDWSIDWSIDRSIDRSIDWSIDWLIGWYWLIWRQRCTRRTKISGPGRSCSLHSSFRRLRASLSYWSSSLRASEEIGCTDVCGAQKVRRFKRNDGAAA